MNYNIVEVDKKTWRIENVFVYSFLLVGDERAIMIDSGCSIENMKEVVQGILKENGYTKYLDKPIEVITTHGDGDHTNAHNQFPAYYVTSEDYEQFEFAKKYPDAEYKQIVDGQIIDIGNRPLQIITVPGHTKGSISILDKNNRRLFCGDMVQTGRIFQFGEARVNDKLRGSYEKLEALSSEFDELCPNHATPKLKPEYITKVKEAWDEVQAGKVKPDLRVPDENEWPEGFLIKAYDCEACTFLLPRDCTLGEE